MSGTAKPKLWRRLGGSLLIGLLFGSPLDILCQLLVSRGDIERVFPPIFGLAATSLVAFCFWNRLGQVRLEGLLRSLAIGTLIGVTAGAILGAIIYPPLQSAFRKTTDVLSAAEANEMDRASGVFIGLCIGGLIGAFASGVTHFVRKSINSSLTTPERPVESK
jgi:hypothetical protein